LSRYAIHPPHHAAQAGIQISPMQYTVYIMANKRNGTLYIGVTNDLVRRVWEHKHDLFEGFTKRYQCHMLVWYESTTYHIAAIQKEKEMKKWHRAWKLRLIEQTNPEWRDLSAETI
jgi:putative endonuclease